MLSCTICSFLMPKLTSWECYPNAKSNLVLQVRCLEYFFTYFISAKTTYLIFLLLFIILSYSITGFTIFYRYFISPMLPVINVDPRFTNANNYANCLLIFK